MSHLEQLSPRARNLAGSCSLIILFALAKTSEQTCGYEMGSLFECSSHRRLIREAEQFVVMNIQGREKKQTGFVGHVTEDK